MSLEARRADTDWLPHKNLSHLRRSCPLDLPDPALTDGANQLPVLQTWGVSPRFSDNYWVNFRDRILLDRVPVWGTAQLTQFSNRQVAAQATHGTGSVEPKGTSLVQERMRL